MREYNLKLIVAIKIAHTFFPKPLKPVLEKFSTTFVYKYFNSTLSPIVTSFSC